MKKRFIAFFWKILMNAKKTVNIKAVASGLEFFLFRILVHYRTITQNCIEK